MRRIVVCRYTRFTKFSNYRGTFSTWYLKMLSFAPTISYPIVYGHRALLRMPNRMRF